MPHFPVDAPRDRVIKALEHLGFRLVREGNHIAMVRDNPDGTRTPLTMPNHRRIKGSTLPGFSDLQSQQVWVRISGWHPMKALQYKELIKTLRPCCIVLSLPSFGQPVQKA
jgi:predicted RNA binding protein YcfA (HicA-like mRNA interferase family)